MTGDQARTGRVDFVRINQAALRNAEAVIVGLLPDARRTGVEFTALNPHRRDRRPGSFRINLITGKWSDFATGDAGGDLVSLAAFVTGLSQREAAIRLAESLGVDPLGGN